MSKLSGHISFKPHSSRPRRLATQAGSSVRDARFRPRQRHRYPFHFVGVSSLHCDRWHRHSQWPEHWQQLHAKARMSDAQAGSEPHAGTTKKGTTSPTP